MLNYRETVYKMCRCCQSILESCYWHCYGKWQFDESIALYEVPGQKKNDPNIIENLVFWDNVSVIANRAVVTIQPLPEKQLEQKLIPIKEESTELGSSCSKKQEVTFHVDTPETETQSSASESNQNLTDEEKYLKITDGPEKIRIRKRSAVEEKIERALEPPIQRNRKKSLQERRNSAATLTLNLKLDSVFHEIPIIRQSSVPKFYQDYQTIEHNPFVTSQVLTSPIIRDEPQYDLQSVVQIEKEIEHEHANQLSKKTQSRMANIRRKMAPILIKKSSTKSLPEAINHI